MANTGHRSGGAKRGVGETRELVRILAVEGLTPRDIAARLDISTQAVYQHLERLRDAGELPEEVAS